MPRLPTSQDRVMVIGATGEGKSVAALWLLSYADFDIMPWIIIDYKREALIADIERSGAIILYDDRRMPNKAFPEPPTDPGLYIVRPDPDQKEEVNNFLLQVWRNGNTGLFCDEAFMIPQKRPFKAYDSLLTQGRSLNCPMIMLYQRPVDMSQYATSQAEYWAVFRIRKKDDVDKANQYIGTAKGPNGELIDVNYRLPRYYWLWYDVSEDDCCVMRPVPPPQAVLGVFRERLRPQQDEIEGNDEQASLPRPTLRLV